ncbi:sulfatase [Flagellimonas sp.]|uniref:sulfatase family protein n=1 Tax=Flagellimonas sp. TaxID=2058762 RepID=UPI003BB1C34C
MKLNYLFIVLSLCCMEWQYTYGQVSDHGLRRPNILIAISDDQSYPYAGAYGDKTVNTPAFDLVAREGVLFNNAFSTSPGCAPSRSSILTGRYPWQNEEAGGHQSIFPLEYKVFVDVLEENSYSIGFTGKGCAPFNWKLSGRNRNPAGVEFNRSRYGANDSIPAAGISDINYASNFDEFLSKKPKDKPFYFWYGSYEAHREFEEGSGAKAGKRGEDAYLPGFLPDHKPVQTDILDYALEVDWFDYHLGKMIQSLRKAGELENTIIIVTSDNGMAFPRAKANCYEYGIHVPLAVMWKAQVADGRVVDDLVSLVDIAPTIFEITGLDTGGMKPISGKSFKNILLAKGNGFVDPERTAVYSSREKHSSSRWANLGYPIRAIRTKEYLYIRNYAPERWPSGAPQMLDVNDPFRLEDMYGLDDNGKFQDKAFWDIDAALSKTYIIENYANDEVSRYFEMATAKRPEHELYNIKKDPFCMVNLAEKLEYQDELALMKKELAAFLMETKDPRQVGPDPDVFENYQRFSLMRPFPKPDWLRLK